MLKYVCGPYALILSQYRYGDQTARDAHALIDNFKGLKVRDLQSFGK